MIAAFRKYNRSKFDTTHTYTAIGSGIYEVEDGHDILIFGQSHYNPRAVTAKTLDGRLLTFFGYLKQGKTVNQWRALVYDHARKKISVPYDWGNQGEDDFHLQPNICINADGKIIMIGEHRHNDDLRVRISQNAHDINSYTEYLIDGLNAYPQPQLMNNGDIIFACRRTQRFIDSYKSTDGGASFSLIGTVCNTTGDDGYWKYPVLIINHTNNLYQLVIMERNTDVDYRYVHFIKSSDGVTWSNLDGTFSKNITSSSITATELRNNCKVIGDGTNPVYCYGGIEKDGEIYLLCHDNGTHKLIKSASGNWEQTEIESETFSPSKRCLYVDAAGNVNAFRSRPSGETSNRRVVKQIIGEEYEAIIFEDGEHGFLDYAVPLNNQLYRRTLITARANDGDQKVFIYPTIK